MRSPRPASRPPATDGSIAAPAARAWHILLAATIYVACAGAFAADLTQDITWAFGVLYIPVVFTAVFYRPPQTVWWLAAAAVAMVLIGDAFPALDLGTVAIVNRLLSIAAILTSAVLVRIARNMRDLLQQQTHRAEAADRMKTQIFANLSHELRTPLNAIIGFAELLAADCRPDQRIALTHLRAAGHRLLVTIENLLDLAQAADRVLLAERLDLAAVLRQAVDAARRETVERRITLLANIDADTPPVIGDAWAVRRIADNVIGNAMKFSVPGGSVRVATETADDRVFAVVSDTGSGMSAEVLRQLGEPFFQAKSGADRPHQGMGTGLALCRRLADGMGATLEFVSEPGRGTTVRLGLHAA